MARKAKRKPALISEAFKRTLQEYGMYQPITGPTAEFFENARQEMPSIKETIDADEQRFKIEVGEMRKTKMQTLRMLYGLADDAQGWMTLAYLLAFEIYPGFHVTPKLAAGNNKKWATRDKALLLIRIDEAMTPGVLLKQAIGTVKQNFPTDYGKFSERVLAARYHEFKAQDRAEMKRLKAAGISPLAILMGAHWRYQTDDAAAMRERAEREPQRPDLSEIPPISLTKH